MDAILILAIWAAVFGGAGSYSAKQKGRESVEGFIMGLFGPLGLLVAALMPTRNAPVSR